MKIILTNNYKYDGNISDIVDCVLLKLHRQYNFAINKETVVNENADISKDSINELSKYIGLYISFIHKKDFNVDFTPNLFLHWILDIIEFRSKIIRIINSLSLKERKGKSNEQIIDGVLNRLYSYIGITNHYSQKMIKRYWNEFKRRESENNDKPFKKYRDVIKRMTSYEIDSDSEQKNILEHTYKFLKYLFTDYYKLIDFLKETYGKDIVNSNFENRISYIKNN